MQKTDFPIELIIGEDCSTDRTREIVLEYQKKYPGIIRVITSEENVGARKNALRTNKACRGKYIAFCEGDDYWHQSLKLQKQVDYLEAHPDVGLVHTNVDRIEIETGIKKINFCNIGNVYKKIGIYHSLLLGDYSIYTCTVCLRRTLIEKIKDDNPDMFDKKFKMGDLQQWLEMSRISKIVYFPESMGTYNVQIESASHTKNINKKISFLQSSYELRKHYISKYNCLDSIKNEIHAKVNKKLLQLALQSQNSYLGKLSLNKIKQYSTQGPSFKDKLRFILATQKIGQYIYRIYRIYIHFARNKLI